MREIENTTQEGGRGARFSRARGGSNFRTVFKVPIDYKVPDTDRK